MDGGVVADGDHLADDDRVDVAHAVENGAVLHVGFSSDADGIDVSADDGVHPDAGLFSEHDVADNLCGWIDIASFADDRHFALVTPNH